MSSEDERLPEHEEPRTEEPSDDELACTLSPAVRRLVRQYALDITDIRGTGPDGRIRVGDVMAFIGGRAHTAALTEEAARVPGAEASVGHAAATSGSAADREAPEAAPEPAARETSAITTVFECDISRVVAHRRQQRERGADVALTSYFLVACGEAVKAAPEVVNPRAPLHLRVFWSSAEGRTESITVDASEDSPLQALDERLATFDAALRTARPERDLRRAQLLVHHHGLSGSVIATPTPIGDGHVASLGIGRVRREIVIREANGEETPRVAAVCYVTLSFYPDRLELHRANRFLSQLARVVEQWPADHC